MAPTPNTSERVFLASPVAGPGSGVIAAPFQFLMTGEDNLLVTAWADDPSLEITLTGRFLKESGEILPFVRAIPAGATIDGRATLLPLGAGFLLNLALIASTASVVWGRMYARVDVVRGSIGARVVLGQMIGGYVTSASYVAWPGSAISNPWEGVGYLREQVLADSIGAGPAFFIAADIARYQVVQLRATFTPSATVATRRPFVTTFLTSGMNITAHSAQGYGAGDGASVHQWAIGLGSPAGYNRLYVLNPLPGDFWIFPGQSLQIQAQNIQSGDTITNPRLLLRQYLSLP